MPQSPETQGTYDLMSGLSLATEKGGFWRGAWDTVVDPWRYYGRCTMFPLVSALVEYWFCNKCMLKRDKVSRA
jgi:hypothetical protein